MVRRLVSALFLVLFVASAASAQSVPTLRASMTRAAAQSVAASSWQQQYDVVLAQKNRAKRRMFIGAGAALGGILVTAFATDSCINSNGACSGSGAVGTLGWLTSLAGDGVFIWGLVDFLDKNGELSRLQAQRPAGKNAAVFVLDGHQSIAVHAGVNSSVSYRVGW